MEWSLTLSIIQQKQKNLLPQIFILPVVSYSRPGNDQVLCLYVCTELHLLQLCNPEAVTLPLAAKANDQPLTAFRASFAWGWMCKSMRASSVVSYQSSDYSFTIHRKLNIALHTSRFCNRSEVINASCSIQFTRASMEVWKWLTLPPPSDASTTPSALSWVTGPSVYCCLFWDIFPHLTPSLCL